ncbi:MAG: peptidylprolyl isomerase [Luminiphilus sp.]|nr:peptidylprolyl isomerase [Luminiphilus sp.]
MKTFYGVLLLALCAAPLTLRAEELLSVNDITVSEDELYHYLEEFLVPQAYESGVSRPNAIKNALVNLYVVRRAASLAVTEGLVTDEEVAYRQADGGFRVGLNAFVSDRAGKALAATDWEALADERYLMERDTLGPREQVDVQHLLIDLDGRSFAELMARTLEVQAKIDAGEDFTALVTAYSDDPSAKRNEGGLGFINPGQTHPAFEKMAFSLNEPGQISEPVLTSFGVHFIRFNQRRRRDAIPQDTVQKSLIRAIKKERESALKGEVLAPLRGEAWPGVADIDEAAIAERVLRRLVPDT